jgi:hypothetical protein
MRLIRPKTDMNGLRGQRDLAQRILAELQSMEEDYFRSKT